MIPERLLPVVVGGVVLNIALWTDRIVRILSS